MTNQATTANPCSLALRLAAMIALCDTENRDDMDLTLLQVHALCQLHRASSDAETRELAQYLIFKFDNGDEPETHADYENWIEALAMVLPPVVVVRA